MGVEKVLVTGGLGFIGSHTVVELLNEGFVVVVDNLANSTIDKIDKIKTITGKEFEFYEVDVTDEVKTEKVFANSKISSVIHFAGYKSVSESVEQPLMYYQNNLISTIVVSKLCLKYNVKKIVFSSSSSVYGNNKPPLVETMELMPTISPYGETKAMCERILKDMFKANKDFEISILRYFNPIGAHESGLLNDELDSNANNIMSYILQVANGMREKVFVFGDDYNTIDGTGIRDYIHVVDLAKGHVLALENIKNGCEIYNLGTGNGYSVLQLINEFVKVNNINIPYEIVKRRDGDIEASFANCSKANKYLGFETKYDLTKMCEHSYKVL